jgi:penicillin-insensitive murein endopeptidase
MRPFCMRAVRLGAFSLAALLTVAAGPPDTPAPAPVRIIGTEASGCIAGATELPQHGPGFEQIRASRSSFWGAPSTIAGIETLAARARAAGLPDIYVGDISGPRGGPLRGGHASHQLGIDVDVWLDVDPKPALTPEQRDAIEVASVVAPGGRSVDPARWSPALVTLMHLAATLPGVDRIFVNPAIKKQLCEQVTGDRSWLRLMRPWWGHASHMHIRFRCPAGQPECHQGPPPPQGDGCDATLDWWFAELAKPSAPAKPSHPKPLPAACRAIMQAPAG